MSLTNRLLVFLLSLLAAVLIGFSLAVYLLVNHYLRVEADERLAAAMNTLVSSIDIEPDNVEWEPDDRTISLPRGPLGDEVCWFITDIDGHVLDASLTPGTEKLRRQIASTASSAPALELNASGDGWHYLQRHVQASQISEGDLHRQRTAEEIEKGEYSSLIVVVGISQVVMRQATQNLIFALAAVGFAFWGACFAMGRLICRRALQPVTRMAEAASAMSSRDLNQRLPAVPSGDELATMNRAFNQLLDRLETAFERQRRFTGDASHQLRTPLTIIQGQAEVALRRTRSAEEYQEVLQTVRQQVRKLNALVESLLFLARAESESALPALQLLDLASWLTEFERSWKSPQENAVVRFERSAITSPIVSAHPEMLSEIARNLLDNAIKYSPPRSPVVVHLIESKRRVGFCIEDEGSGMSQDEVSHVFQPFFRSESAQRSGTEGSGLGLSIASRLSAAMNGTIEVESQPNRGSRFSVWLTRSEA
ncbi:MAG: HAMP domain-containing protein [Pirellulales bacterium]|nr:HAMP domain-containing protein [Pirellulales bacterium]